MLTYLGHGFRTYGQTPYPQVRRNLWDFQAIIDGVAAPTFPNESEPQELTGNRIWVFAPDCIHGWTGHKNNPCEVCVMQFPYVSEVLQNVIPDNGWISVPLSPANILDIRKFIDIGIEQLRAPSPVSQLHFQSILTSLSIILMEALDMNQMSPVASHARLIVGKAIEWYGENLRHAPTLEDVARSVSVSPAHLRRMFHQALDLSPKEALDQLRFRRSHELLENPRNTIEVIAELTGFYSASAFSRAFKNRIGVCPKGWREQIGKSPIVSEKQNA